ncbi:MAG TPA: dephospho-CoA kinase [Candidatus Acidoferrum sp.]|jgi:dephospho-CoA kinase
MLRLGLTGGIASGKSTVAFILREFGFVVLEADIIAHQIIQPGTPAHEEVAREFGAEILNEDLSVNRAALAKIVFNDLEKLQRLNAIIHPRVEARVLSEFEKLQRHGNYPAAFVEAALIFEAALDQKLDGVVVAWCQPEQQIARLLSRGMLEEDARRRIAAQLPVEEKLRRATDKIDCSGSLAETRSQVELLVTKLRAARPTD